MEAFDNTEAVGLLVINRSVLIEIRIRAFHYSSFSFLYPSSLFVVRYAYILGAFVPKLYFDWELMNEGVRA